MANLRVGLQYLYYHLYQMANRKAAEILMNEFNFRAEFTIKKIICPNRIYFPTAFTPNDDGINDTYKPGIFGKLVIYELAIFNRYGQKVFGTSSPNTSWTGLFKGRLQTGTYTFYCQYQFEKEKNLTQKGSFLLLR